MAVTIKKATFGDERSNTDITNVLAEQMRKRGTTEIPVNSSLVPVLGKGPSSQLNDQEVRDAYDRAAEVCGPTDQICKEMKAQEFQAQRLQEKKLENAKVENIIKGRRLTVEYVQNGKVKTAEIPEGQVFKLENSKTAPAFKVDPGKPVASEWSIMGTLSSVAGILVTLFASAGGLIATFFYAYSILSTFRAFNEEGKKMLTYLFTAIAVLVPYSGYIIQFVYFGFDSFSKNLTPSS
jgi:hypothetical protein